MSKLAGTKYQGCKAPERYHLNKDQENEGANRGTTWKEMFLTIVAENYLCRVSVHEYTRWGYFIHRFAHRPWELN